MFIPTYLILLYAGQRGRYLIIALTMRMLVFHECIYNIIISMFAVCPEQTGD